MGRKWIENWIMKIKWMKKNLVIWKIDASNVTGDIWSDQPDFLVNRLFYLVRPAFYCNAIFYYNVVHCCRKSWMPQPAAIGNPKTRATAESQGIVWVNFVRVHKAEIFMALYSLSTLFVLMFTTISTCVSDFGRFYGKSESHNKLLSVTCT